MTDQDFQGLEFRIDGRPDYSLITVNIPANETIKVESSAMASMDSHLQMKTKMRGGFKRFMSGESIFLNEFTAPGAPGEIKIAPPTPGDAEHIYLDDQELMIQNSAFVACGMGIELDFKFQGLKGFFSGEGLFMGRAHGTGDLWFNSFGAIIPIDVEDEEYIVDTGHIVAFEPTLDYNVESIGGYKSLFFSGEGLVCRFRGHGRVWIQSRAAAPFVNWAHAFRPVESSN